MEKNRHDLRKSTLSLEDASMVTDTLGVVHVIWRHSYVFMNCLSRKLFCWWIFNLMWVVDRAARNVHGCPVYASHFLHSVTPLPNVQFHFLGGNFKWRLHFIYWNKVQIRTSILQQIEISTFFIKLRPLFCVQNNHSSFCISMHKKHLKSFQLQIHFSLLCIVRWNPNLHQNVSYGILCKIN